MMYDILNPVHHLNACVKGHIFIWSTDSFIAI